MPLNTSTQLRFDSRRLQTLRHLLGDHFGTLFDIWFYDDQWLKITDDDTCDCEIATDAECTTLDAARNAADSAYLEPSEDGILLVIPLPRRHWQQLFAMARFDKSHEPFLERLARIFMRDLSLQDEVVQLRLEHEAFLRQVTHDFEELSFLRSMAGLLEISDLTFDLVSMGEAMLPTLKPLVDSDALILVPSDLLDDEKERETNSRCVWCGTQGISDKMCLDLVRKFQHRASTQPVVRNKFERTTDGAKFPGVHSLIMVPIASGDVTVGWLLALNRNNERNTNVEDLPWKLSYLEFGTHEATLMSSSAAILATHARNVHLFREREQLLVSIVRALVSAVEAKDEYTHGHSERVALYGRCLAQQLGLDEKYCEQLYLTGLLHDVGKIGVSDAILRKPGPLTDEEFEEIKKHPDKGWQILRDLTPLNYVLDGVLHHHEQFDGHGYPDQLAGANIPLSGRILAVADAYDAMTSDRPYRKGMAEENAESILRSGAGKQWDAEIVDAFFRGRQQILQIKTSYQPRIAKVRKESAATL